ncbi:polysaccharide biosynthesis tyrosine autokinase [Roseiconus nitratireducens]|uniref:polysaccharide biosynthesis tyrosine autokinase n=1 Tax=Roseiconus nitratireducens TaxID=2605748 RepID=UPI00137599A4|nr:polysaccharide biosynthesis tyrosine autokinase [Roseiconus nitratireducens]
MRRTWYWAVPVGLVLASVAAFAVLKQFVPRYESSALLEASRDYVAFKGVMPALDDIARTEKPLIVNPVVLDPILQDPELRNAPSLSDPEQAEQNLRDNLSIRSAGSKSRMEVSYTDTDREYAQKICTAIVVSYLSQRDSMDTNRVNSLINYLTPAIRDREKKVQEKQDIVQKLSEKTLGYNPSAPLSSMENQHSISLFGQLQSQISSLEAEIEMLDAIEKGQRQDRENLASNGENLDYPKFVPPIIDVRRDILDPDEVNAMAENDPAVVEARQRYNYFKDRVFDMENNDVARMRKEYYREMMDQRDEWEEKLLAFRKEARTRAEKAMKERIEFDYQRRLKDAEGDIERQKIAFQNEYRRSLADRDRQNQAELERQKWQDQEKRRQLVARLASVREQYEQERERMKKYSGASAELEFAQQELAIERETLQTLRNRIDAIRTESEHEGVVRLLADATEPRSPVENVPVKKMAMAGGACFLIPFVFGLLWEMRTNRVTDIQVLEKTGGLAPIVGELARSPAGQNGRGSRGRRVFQESVDTLRANLFLSESTRDARSFAIVSSMSGEGKSTAASQLAISLAKATGKTVLLIDADMRCPDQHDVFGLTLEPGLSGVLLNEVKFEDAVRTELGDLIHVLPAGRLKASPHRLMSPAKMRELIDQALKRYDFVIVDTAPVLSASETLAVAASVDTTLVCAMRDVTRKDSVVRTTHRLEAAGANVAGTIFNGVTPRQYAYRYGDYTYAGAGEIPDYS